MNKTCSICFIEKPNTTEFFHRIRAGGEALHRRCAECDRAKNRKWREANPDKRKAAASRRLETKKAGIKARRQSDPAYAMVLRLRTRTRHALKGALKPETTMDLVGCSAEQLANHISSQFADGMSWDNRSDWHIDHIRPLSSFDLTDADQRREACHFSNLKPLWAAENLSKGASA